MQYSRFICASVAAMSVLSVYADPLTPEQQQQLDALLAQQERHRQNQVVVGSRDGVNLVLNSTVGGQVLVNGANLMDVIDQYNVMSAQIESLQSTIDADRSTTWAAINSLTHSPTQTPTPEPTRAPSSTRPTFAPSSAVPTQVPTATPTSEPTPYAQDSCWSLKQSNPNAPSGNYRIVLNTTGEEITVYCDMTTDGGGWALVFHENQNCRFATSNNGAQTVCGMANNPIPPGSVGGSAKYSDAQINALRVFRNTQAAYRATSNDISNRYFFPGTCNYAHQASSSNPCMSFNTNYQSTSYIQCSNWGGGGGGLNAWYQCSGSGYTNVLVTTRTSGYSQQSGITTNSNGNNYGSSSTTYHNDVLIWVR